MALAIVVAAAVLVDDGSHRRHVLLVLVAGLTVGSVIGLLTAQRVHMTDMPQLVSLFNAVGGGAAVLVAFVEVLRVATSSPRPGSTTRSRPCSTCSSARSPSPGR
jgi:NAD(P) transhydrogenase subunit beta